MGSLHPVDYFLLILFFVSMYVCVCVWEGVESGRATEYTLIVHRLYQYICTEL